MPELMPALDRWRARIPAAAQLERRLGHGRKGPRNPVGGRGASGPASFLGSLGTSGQSVLQMKARSMCLAAAQLLGSCFHAIATASLECGAASPPRLYEEGPAVNWRLVVGSSSSCPRGVEQRSCLYGLLGGRTRRNWIVRSRAQVQKGGQAARRKAAPRGANSSFRVSMCQIAWASRRAMSIWATLAPRCLPSRFLFRW
jgi:hypothetical protein